jgi:UDP-N-acetylmuramate dehydrogenase
MSIKEQLQKLDIKFLADEPLKNHTTFQIGGPARYYVELSQTENLMRVLKIAKENKLKYLFLGGGSNLLVSDQGFDGLIIKIRPAELEFEDSRVTANSGCILAGLIIKCLENGLTGLEFAAGVPGTVGGAIKGNAGTYGEAMEKAVESVRFIDENLQLKTFSKKECRFAYRHSIFKEHDEWLITSAVIKLKKGDVTASKKLIQERIGYRMQSQPYGHPSAGCAFKNIIYSDEIADKLKSLGWEVSPKFKEYKKIPTAYVIENLGLKGKTIGAAQISEKHANYIINLGGATADEVIQLISYIKQQVRDTLGIQLQEEIRYLGF